MYELAIVKERECFLTLVFVALDEVFLVVKCCIYSLIIFVA